MKRMSRRGFVIGSGAAASLAAACACTCTKTGRATITGVGATPAIKPGAYAINNGELRIDLLKEDRLAVAGSSVKILDKGLREPLIVVRESQGTFIAASVECTHRGVEVEYHPEKKCFKCASLGGTTYKTDGSRIKGFGKGPLSSYSASVEDDVVIIKLA